VKVLQFFDRHSDEIVQVFGRHAVGGYPGNFFRGGWRKSSHDVAYDLGEFGAKPEPEPVRLARRLQDGGVTLGGAFVGPHEDVAQQLDAVEFIDPQKSVDIGACRDVNEGEGAQVLLNEWNVRGQPRHAFVDVFKRLQIRELNQGEECLLERLVIAATVSTTL